MYSCTAAHVTHLRAKKLRSRKALPVPISCVYSLSDGVVPPQEATIDGDPAMHENIRVPGSHIGLGFNPIVLWILADRLAQPEGLWRPFDPSGVGGRLYRLLTWRFGKPEHGASPAPSPPPGAARGRGPGTPGTRRARIARTPPGRASARGRMSATR